MTFTEAAIEVLRRAGKPLHVKDIAGEAVNAGILSHVGQTPEETMGSRLLAMARRDQDRRVVAMEPGFFALAEWGLPPPTPPAEASPAAEAVATGAAPVTIAAPPVAEATPAQAELPYRDRERHPPLQKEIVVGNRRDERRRPRDGDGDGRRHKRYPLPAETAWQWLRDKGEPAALADIAKSLRESDRIAEALERDLGSFEKALHEENKRRKDGRRPLLFEFTADGLVRALEPQQQPRPERQAQRLRREEPVRPIAADEQRRNVLRSIRRRIGSLDGAALERVSVALLEAQGYSGLNMVRRSQKDGPLYLARHKFGAGELRYAIRVLRPDRMISREDVQGVRHDLAKYSAQMGAIIGSGECGREAKSEANISNDSPVLLYGGEALAEALLDAGFGATKRLIEWLEYDDDFFTSVGAGDALPDVEGAEPEPVETEAEATPVAPEQADRSRERDRHRNRRPRRGPREGQRETPRPVEAAPDGTAAVPADQSAPVAETPVAPQADAAPPEAALAPEHAPVEAAPQPPPEAPAPPPEPPPPPLDA